MQQSKLESLIESVINQLSGVLISLLWWSVVIVPVFNFDVNFSSNVLITLSFTTISVIRSYLWRRFFNAGLHRIIRKRYE